MWLILLETYERMAAAIKAGIVPTAEQQTEIFASSDEGPRNYTTAGEIAEISVKGVLTEEKDFFAMFFGGGNTTYKDIRASLALAENDPKIKGTLMRFDSPGGNIDGLFDTIAAIDAYEKPITAVVGNKAASAAFALASVCDSIECSGKASAVGSVGVVVDTYIDNSIVTITSTNAPKKRPDPSTDEGKAQIREYLDGYEELFIDAIATGRKKSVDYVKSNFGRGAMVLAGDALEKGMIDKITSIEPRKNSGKGASSMDVNKLKAEYPAVYAAIIGEGVAQERDRAGAHAIMGRQTGAVDIALKAIEEGTGMTATMQATYMTAGLNKTTVDAHQGEGDSVATVVDGAQVPAEKSDADASSKLTAAVLEKCGIEA